GREPRHRAPGEQQGCPCDARLQERSTLHHAAILGEAARDPALKECAAGACTWSAAQHAADCSRMDHGTRLQQAATQVADLRRSVAADQQARAWVHAVKSWQAHRLARTHRDLLSEPRHGPAARFFLQDLYGAKDFSQRDAELAKIVPMMVRLLPDAALATIADAVEMDALSERMDLALARD